MYSDGRCMGFSFACRASLLLVVLLFCLSCFSFACRASLLLVVLLFCLSCFSFACRASLLLVLLLFCLSCFSLPCRPSLLLFLLLFPPHDILSLRYSVLTPIHYTLPDPHIGRP